MKNAKFALRTTRPPFLVLAPICVWLGLSTSLASSGAIDYGLLLLVILGAVSAHISVNTFNEYVDFKSGLDLNTVKTPFSGGSGALPDSPGLVNSVLMIAVASLVLTIVIGIYFMRLRGIVILPIGLLGVLLVVAYTPWINRLPLLCLIAPGLGFGPLMVVGTQIILTSEISLLVCLAALVPFFLTNNLLLLNQYPDLKADADAGRKTFPIVFGLEVSNRVYTMFMVLAYLMVLLLVILQWIPWLGLLAVLPLGCSIYALIGAKRYGSKIGNYPQFLAANVAATLLTPLLMGFAIIFG